MPRYREYAAGWGIRKGRPGVGMKAYPRSHPDVYCSSLNVIKITVMNGFLSPTAPV